MKTFRFILLAVAVLPFAALRAGDDGVSMRPAFLSLTAQMNAYLDGQKITHAVENTGGDFKGDGAETLTVKIYGVSVDARQEAICTALAATVKRSRVRSATVQFFTLSPAGAVQPVVFQPSQLPSGNASVEFPRDPSPPSYRLQRTAKL